MGFMIRGEGHGWEGGAGGWCVGKACGGLGVGAVVTHAEAMSSGAGAERGALGCWSRGPPTWASVGANAGRDTGAMGADAARLGSGSRVYFSGGADAGGAGA